MFGLLATVAGGLFNRSAQKKANAANTPAAQVAGWEAAGINPLVGITKGQWQPQQAVTAIGDSFLNAGSLFSQEADRQNRLTVEKTRQQGINSRLEKELRASKSSTLTNTQKYGAHLDEISSSFPFDPRPTISDGSPHGNLTDTLEKPKVEPIVATPLTSVVRLGNGTDPWISLNPDMFDIGVNELVGGTIVHGGSALINGVLNNRQILGDQVDANGGFNNPRRGQFIKDGMKRRSDSKKQSIIDRFTRGDYRFPARKPSPFN